ncbi:MAG: hypothetical protein ABJ263_16470 [Tateyamaria sp.]|uniref:hypothetical protein n=1 Tax=Tateyamaria sp. TaxID=1929288 RepID=UPI00328FB6DA
MLFFSTCAPFSALAQSAETATSRLHLELNNLQDIEGACRLSFVAKNETGAAIDRAIFETVVFDATGGVVNLTLFDFQDLPVDRARVRQFDLAGMGCSSIGKALVNGASSCVVEGAESTICKDALSLSSRLSVELFG